MGLGDFFKNIFGKKTCAFCGGECVFWVLSFYFTPVP